MSKVVAVIFAIATLFLASQLALTELFPSKHDIIVIKEICCILLSEFAFLNWILKMCMCQTGPLDASLLADDELEAKNCVFCTLAAANGREKVFEDETVVAFYDINPGAATHILVIPKVHIGTVKSLNHTHLELLKHMRTVGKLVLELHNVPSDRQQLGFHVPPFNSITHLHLHSLGKPFKNFYRFMKYPEGITFAKWYISIDDLIRKVESKDSVLGT